jgi:hypothetical protein
MPQKLTPEKFITKAKSVHGNSYDYSLVNYLNNRIKVEIICKKGHGSFWQSPYSHLRDCGCPKCGGVHRSTKEEFIIKSNQLHDNRYDYFNVIYVNNQTRVRIICPQHGLFIQTPNSHLNGSGCPICHTSKGELLTEKHLNDNGIVYIKQMTFDGCRGTRGYKLRFDFYLPNYNILIEIDGIQHYTYGQNFNGHKITKEEFERTKRNDEIKTRYAFDNKIKMVRIPYRNKKDYNNIVPILTKEIL